LHVYTLDKCVTAKQFFKTKYIMSNIEKASGKLGVLIPGLGAVATTFIAGVEAVKKGIAQPIGSLTQMSNIRLGKKNRKQVS